MLSFSEVVRAHEGKYTCRALISESATENPDFDGFIAQTSEPYDFKGKVAYNVFIILIYILFVCSSKDHLQCD